MRLRRLDDLGVVSQPQQRWLVSLGHGEVEIGVDTAEVHSEISGAVAAKPVGPDIPQRIAPSAPDKNGGKRAVRLI
jgi:hypothetical protein